ANTIPGLAGGKQHAVTDHRHMIGHDMMLWSFGSSLMGGCSPGPNSKAGSIANIRAKCVPAGIVIGRVAAQETIAAHTRGCASVKTAVDADPNEACVRWDCIAVTAIP